MKKIITVIIISFSILGLVYLYKGTDILDFVKCEQITMEERQRYAGRWYYNNLTDNQKEIYLYFAKSVDNKEESAKLKINSSLTSSQIEENINKAIEAYIYDYPETFYIETSCRFKTINLINSKIVEIYPTYLYGNSVENMQQELQQEINKIKTMLNDSMTEYQKELLVHDYLVKNIEYYEWEDIKDIPNAMHNAYSAIVKKQAVCDGFAKAFQIIMQEEGIQCMLVNGMLEDVAHAWNIVNIEGDYYHIDLTSDQLKIGEESESNLSHTFFNLTDEEIKETHEKNENYNYPSCIAQRNNYYNKENRVVKQGQNLKHKVKNIVDNIKDEKLLEIKVVGTKDVSSEIAQILYEINFNNYKTNQVESIMYTKTRDVYIYKIK